MKMEKFMDVEYLNDKRKIDEIVNIHMKSFSGFFLTFLGKGFLKELYQGFLDYQSSGIIIAKNNNEIIGFLAFSENLSGFYSFLIKKRFFNFAFYAINAFLKKPKIMMRLLRAFRYSDKAKRNEKYLELSSIGVDPDKAGNGVGTKMIEKLILSTDSKKYEYIKLETDSDNNEQANRFYKKNGFVINHIYETPEGRKMNEYRYYLSKEGDY